MKTQEEALCEIRSLVHYRRYEEALKIVGNMMVDFPGMFYWLPVANMLNMVDILNRRASDLTVSNEVRENLSRIREDEFTKLETWLSHECEN